jgi:hypothetical protein
MHILRGRKGPVSVAGFLVAIALDGIPFQIPIVGDKRAQCLVSETRLALGCFLSLRWALRALLGTGVAPIDW